MKMRSELLLVAVLMALMSEFALTTPTPKKNRWTAPNTASPNTTITATTVTTTTPWSTTTPWTTGHPGVNLNGMMFTLSSYRGGISFYPPYYSPSGSRNSAGFTTRPYYTTTGTTYSPWTTAPVTRGLSVCLRFLTDYLDRRGPTIFRLSPSSSRPLSFGVSDPTTNTYILGCNQYSYSTLRLQPSIKFLPEVAPDIWTRVCLTMDPVKKVAQVFRGSNMSIRKILPDECSWTGEPVIDFSSYDGQLTDLQMWDYPLRYREVIDYMNAGVYKQYRGNILTWSYISYSLQGNSLLEEVYEIQVKEPMSRRGKGRRTKGAKKTRRVFNMAESKDRETL